MLLDENADALKMAKVIQCSVLISYEILCCKVNGHVSNLDEIKYGVPQGSCLGPLLFLMHIDDLLLLLKSSNLIVCRCP